MDVAGVQGSAIAVWGVPDDARDASQQVTPHGSVSASTAGRHPHLLRDVSPTEAQTACTPCFFNPAQRVPVRRTPAKHSTLTPPTHMRTGVCNSLTRNKR
ncbi:hypothetical protein FRC07_004905, partial [Ceratobasidium sp. 392]